MDVWRLIARDHANIEQLIHDAPRALNGPGVMRSRERLLRDLIDELQAHATAIESSLYGHMARHTETSQLVAELYAGHKEFIRHLNNLTDHSLKGFVGWLDAFEDATFLVDQYLHEHKHELLPAAQKLLARDEVRDATHNFIRAKTRLIRSRRRTMFGGLASNQLGLGLGVCALAAGLGYVLGRSRLIGGLDGRSRSKTH